MSIITALYAVRQHPFGAVLITVSELILPIHKTRELKKKIKNDFK